MEHRFSPREIGILRRVVHARLGINISEEKEYLLVNKFGRMMDDLRLERVRDLIEALKQPTSEIELKLARFLTTNHTFFFREAQHFSALCQLVNRYPSRKPRIWCAASSTGEEVYSIVIHLLEAGINDFLLVASDINLEVLKACRDGLYRADRVLEVPRHLLFKYFNPVDRFGVRQWQVKQELRKRVILKRLNLMDDLRFEQDFHFVFCRNVMIYFDPTTQAKVVSHLLATMAPEGYLFVGHAEPLINIRERIIPVAPSIYLKPR